LSSLPAVVFPTTIKKHPQAEELILLHVDCKSVIAKTLLALPMVKSKQFCGVFGWL
jgi:hypothetical protein